MYPLASSPPPFNSAPNCLVPQEPFKTLGSQATPVFPSPVSESKSKSHLKSFAQAGAFFTAALMLKRIPPRLSAYTLIPTDWKQWAKAGLGVAGISQLNQGLEWKPPLWLGTAQTVVILTPLLQKLEKGWLRQLLILTPLITGLVQVNHWVSEKAEGFLERKFNIPPLVTQLGFSILTTITGMKAFPVIDKTVDDWLGKAFGLENRALSRSQEAAMATSMTCARGCCASAVCINELGEYGSAFYNWMKQTNPKKDTP